MKKNILLLAVVLFASVLSWRFYSVYAESKKNNNEQQCLPAETATAAEAKKDRVEEVAIKNNDTYGGLMESAGLDHGLIAEIYDTARPVYDLARIRSGKTIYLTYDKDTDELKALLYRIDTEDQLVAERKAATGTPALATTTPANEDASGQASYVWTAEVTPIPYEVREKTAAGAVTTSMYEAALENNIDIRAIIELANAFQWTIDFALDPRLGDTFRFVYEERYLDGEYVMPGQILAGRYVNDGTPYEVYYFEETAANAGFFDEQGNSVQKMFLKAPVAFRYISSGFTTGLRYIQAFNISTGHRAIDYAAAAGTPIRAVGDGTVVFAGWNGSYGYMTSIRHNGTYTTNYAHQSKMAVKKGQSVKQGEVIGYVGSTGLSTGPHLHYEMVKDGVKINPLREILPPGEPIKEENRARFLETIESLRGKLNVL